MQPLFIRAANLFLLVIILVGIPAITGKNIGWLRLSNAVTAQTLTLWGLGLAALINGIGAFFFRRKRPVKIICWRWVAIFLVLLAVEILLIRHVISFDWLKDLLVWGKRNAPAGGR